MTITVGRYTFGAWMRKGLGRAIEDGDTLGSSNGTLVERAITDVDVDVNGEGVKKKFALLGPGDVIGVNPQTVVRTEPHHWVTDFEPNYLPFVEFYDEDFIWRYTPAKAAGDRLRPWLALAVLEEESAAGPGEFELDEHQLPLPRITVKSAASLPSPSQVWAWGHVHVNEGFEGATDFERFLESLETEDHPNADRIVCRLTSPRHLKPNTPYSAFVVPTFETGRRAGLKQDPTGLPAQQPAWAPTDKDVVLPVYYQWRFRTGENEDFESLAKKLEPRPADHRVGIRDMDGEKPGWGIDVGTDIGHVDPPPATPPDPPPPPPRQSVIGLEGALKAPNMQSRPPKVDVTKLFLKELQEDLNLPEERRNNPATKDLPLVSPPIYGEHHALRHTVDVSREDWLDFLNRDPRQRVPAGFGTEVIQKGQEGYVARAWQQVQKVLEANKKIRLVKWAMQVSQAIYVNFAQQLEPAQKVVFFGPLLSKVRGSPTTLAHQMSESTLPPAAVSGAMRRLVRPRGPVGRRVGAADGGFSQAGLVQGMAAGELTAAPPKPVPGDLATDTEVSSQLSGSQLPPWLQSLLGSSGLLLALLALLLVIVFVLAVVTGAWLLFGLIALGLVAIAAAVFFLARRTQESEAVTDPAVAAAAAAAAPQRPDFHLVETDPVVPPAAEGSTDVTSSAQATSASSNAAHYTEFSSFTPSGSGDSVEGRDFRHAAVALGERLGLTVPEPELHPFDLGNAGAKLSSAVDPLVVFPLQLSTQVRFPFDPEWLLEPEHLVPAMAYPDFDDPMYQGLRDVSSELLLPNIGLIPQNTVTLLLTNPPFIESYMVGLNTEFGKELLWREYPTDRRGSYFRQFWDVKGIIAAKTEEDPAELSERAKDITPIDTWESHTALGSHRNPKRGKGEHLVLTVRGELLKKYPNTLIYAQKAHLYHDSEGHPEPAHEPVLGEVASEKDIEEQIKFPVFKASVEPDVRFFGFDISAEEARGAEHPQQEGDDWGYYFVIQQLPGEPRFGMDVAFEPDEDATTPITWDDLAWDRFPPDQEFIDVGVGPSPFVPAGPGESSADWGKDASRMASILFQKPVMIAMHAKEMLEGLDV
ncbi:MAG: hypothetical protein ACTHN3_06315 [Solirubrobacterales bacterium]